MSLSNGFLFRFCGRKVVVAACETYIRPAVYPLSYGRGSARHSDMLGSNRQPPWEAIPLRIAAASSRPGADPCSPNSRVRVVGPNLAVDELAKPTHFPALNKIDPRQLLQFPPRSRPEVELWLPSGPSMEQSWRSFWLCNMGSEGQTLTDEISSMTAD